MIREGGCVRTLLVDLCSDSCCCLGRHIFGTHEAEEKGIELGHTLQIALFLRPVL